MTKDELLRELQERAPLLYWEVGSDVGPPQTTIRARVWINGQRLTGVVMVDDTLLEHVENDRFVPWILSDMAHNVAQAMLEWTPDKQDRRMPHERALEYARYKWPISDDTRIVRADLTEYDLPVKATNGWVEEETIHLEMVYGFEPITAMGYGPRTDTLAIYQQES
jgi:hypothetical protein